MSSAEVLASVDIVALRLNPGHGLELLLIRRAQAPFAGQWALPGVLVNGRSADHSLDDAAVRALRDKARLEPAYIEQVATVGNAVRDPRGWSLSVFYLVLVGPDTRVEDDDLDFVPLRGSQRALRPAVRPRPTGTAGLRAPGEQVGVQRPAAVPAGAALHRGRGAEGLRVRHRPGSPAFQPARAPGADEGGWLGRGHRRTPASAHGAPATRPAFHPEAGRRLRFRPQPAGVLTNGCGRAGEAAPCRAC